MAQSVVSENKRVVAIAIDESEHAENALKCKSLFYVQFIFHKITVYIPCLLKRALLIS